jgi:hypothetical protein
MRKVNRDRVVVLAMTIAVSACDPCSATFSCEQSPRVAVVGQILDERSGSPVKGAMIELRRVSGVEFLSDDVTATTSRNGTFELEARTKSLGDALITIHIASPGKQPYDVLALTTRATVLTGDATVLRPWVAANPTLPYVIELYRNGTADERIINTEVEFRRSSGVRMFKDGAEISSTTTTTTDIGWAFSFYGITTDNAGDLVGDLIIRFSPSDSIVVAGVGFSSVPTFGPQLGVARIGVGPG